MCRLSVSPRFPPPLTCPTVRSAASTSNGGGGQRVEEQGTWAAQKHSEAGYGRPVDRGAWTAKTVKRPRQQPAHPQYANYWAPLTHKRHIPPHSAQPQHTNYWAPRTRKRHGRQNTATRRNMRREERVSVQGPVQEQQPDGMSHRGSTPPTQNRLDPYPPKCWPKTASGPSANQKIALAPISLDQERRLWRL